MAMNFLLVSTVSTLPSSSAVNYCWIQDTFNSGFSATESSRLNTVPEAFDLSNLYIALDTAPGTGASWVFTVRKNQVDTALTVTIADTNTSNTDSSHTVSFSAADTISISATPANTPTSPGKVYWNILGNNTTSNSQIVFGTSGANAAGVGSSTQMVNPWGAAGNTALNKVAAIMPTAGTISKMYVALGSAPGAGTSYAITFRKGSTNQTVTTTIADTNTTGNDTSNSFSVAAGDLLTIQFAPTNTPANTTARWSFIFTPTNYGDTIVGASYGVDPSTSATNYSAILGSPNSAGFSATESTGQQIIGPYLIRKMYSNTGNSPGAGKNYVFKIRKNSADTSLSVTIADAATSGNIASDVSWTQGDKIGISSTPTGTPTSAGGTGLGLLLAFTTTSTSSTSSSTSISTSSTSTSISTSSTSSSTSRSTSTSSTSTSLSTSSTSLSTSSTSQSTSTSTSISTSSTSSSTSTTVSYTTSTSSTSASSTSQSTSLTTSVSTSSTSSSTSTSTTALDISYPRGNISSYVPRLGVKPQKARSRIKTY